MRKVTIDSGMRYPYREFIVFNGKYELHRHGTITYRDEYYEDVYDKDGNSLGEIKLKEESRYEEEEKVFKVSDSRRGYMVQINYDFHLLPYYEGVWNMEELNYMSMVLRQSKDTFPYRIESKRVSGFRRYSKYNSINHLVKEIQKEIDFVEIKEICSVGCSGCIITYDSKIDKEQYKENYLRAKRKYPDHIDEIEELYGVNKQLYV